MVVNRVGSVLFSYPSGGWGGAGGLEEARPVGLNLKDEGVCCNEVREMQTSARALRARKA